MKKTKHTQKIKKIKQSKKETKKTKKKTKTKTKTKEKKPNNYKMYQIV